MQDLTFYLAKTPPLPVLRLDVDIGESSYVRLGLPPLLSSSRNSNTFWSRSTNRGWPRHRCFQALLGFFLSMCCSIDSICANTLAIDGKFLSCSADTGFVLVLPMDHVAMYFGSMAKQVGGAYARDKGTCARTLAENVGGGGLYVKGGVYAGHYGNSSLYAVKTCSKHALQTLLVIVLALQTDAASRECSRSARLKRHRVSSIYWLAISSCALSQSRT